MVPPTTTAGETVGVYSVAVLVIRTIFDTEVDVSGQRKSGGMLNASEIEFVAGS